MTTHAATSRPWKNFASIFAFYRTAPLRQGVAADRGAKVIGPSLAPEAGSGRGWPVEELGMARNGRTLPARRQREAFDDSVLIRSAESLGRMIGSLQRQLDGAAKKGAAGNGFASVPGADGDSAPARRDGAIAKAASANKGSKPSRAAARTGKGASKSGATKVRSTADRASKRASKSAAAKKTAGRGRAAARPSKKNGAAS